jgi:iron complex transport system substrate-binding protein
MNKLLSTIFFMPLFVLFFVFKPVAAKERIVVAGGSLTEIVYALGGQENVVAVDTSSVYPAQTASVPKIGYYRTLNVEGILSLQPTKLLLLEGAGPEKVIQQIKTLGLSTTTINNPKSIDGLVSTIRNVADAIGKKSEGEALITQLKQELAKLYSLPALSPTSAVFLMSAGERGLTAAGKNTTPQLIFDQLALTNPFADLSGYKPVSEEALASARPNVIFIASHTTRGMNSEALCQTAQLKLWAKVNGCHIVKIDSLKFLGLTPRLPEAIADTRKVIAAL